MNHPQTPERNVAPTEQDKTPETPAYNKPEVTLLGSLEQVQAYYHGYYYDGPRSYYYYDG